MSKPKWLQKWNIIWIIIVFSLVGTGWNLIVRADDSTVTAKIIVRSFRIIGQNLVSDSKLQALLAEAIGQPQSLADLEKQADKITQFLRKRGYVVAFAYIPEQDFQNGIVRIVVVPGIYDHVTINNNTKVKDSVIRAQLGNVKSGAVIEQKALERAVWLMGDLAGTEAKATFAPGSKPGTCDLVIDVNPKGKRVGGYLTADNGGNEYTGQYQCGGLLNDANPLWRGDFFSLQASYAYPGLWGGNVTYQTPFAGQGNNIGVSLAKSNYTLGGDFAPLDAYGTSLISSVFWQHNFIRSRLSNLYGQVSFALKSLVDNNISYNDPRTISDLTVGLNGDFQDKWGGGGVNSYSLSYAYGHLAIQDEYAQLLDSGLQTAGDFSKANCNFSRLQHLTDRAALFIDLSYQWAGKNLDSSEQMFLGGPNAIRAYPTGEATGDQGWLGTTELRYNLPSRKGSPNAWQLVGFVDGGSVTVNTTPIAVDTENQRSLSGMGVGFNWNRTDNWELRVNYAWKIGTAPAQSAPDSPTRLWVQFFKYY